MLLNLHITNIALIDDVDVSFGDGFNVLTGETGAGKSIIMGAVNIGLGGKFAKDMVRDEDRDAVVELVFHIDNENTIESLNNMDVTLSEDNELIIVRRLRAGKVINKLNDSSVTVSKIKDIAGLLVDMHSQHETATLLVKENHIKILDGYGHNSIDELLAKVKSLYKEYDEVRHELLESDMDANERLRRIDLLKYEINQIEEADIKDKEDEEYQALYKRYINGKQIVEQLSRVYSATGNSGASDLIGRAYRDLSMTQELSEDLDGLSSTLLDIDNLLNEFNVELSQYLEELEFDDEEFLRVEKRLDTINEMKLKYGNSYEAIMDYYNTAKIEYTKLIDYDNYISKLKDTLNKVSDKLTHATKELTKARQSESKKLVKAIKEALLDLNFLQVDFDMAFEEKDSYSANGKDLAYFVISTNVGEPLKPLYDVASGGELSRIMLAVKSVLADLDNVNTLIFDEIDAGISGRTAQKVSEKLSKLGRNHQVISITHLPQIAAMADNHYIINKSVEGGKTITRITALDEDQAIGEIARLLGGVEITDSVLNNAKEMKELACKTKIG